MTPVVADQIAGIDISFGEVEPTPAMLAVYQLDAPARKLLLEDLKHRISL
jgi:hypothetical protein